MVRSFEYSHPLKVDSIFGKSGIRNFERVMTLGSEGMASKIYIVVTPGSCSAVCLSQSIFTSITPSVTFPMV